MLFRNSFFLLVLFTMCSLSRISAQSKALKIGDKVPDLLLHDFLLGDRASVKLSELKGKLVILDFWATTCTPCVKAMPEMDALQKKFKDQIRILPVAQPFNGDRYAKSKSNIEAFWKKNTYTNRTSLTPITDTILNDYFPHVGVPYEVWINSEGILIGLTSYVNEPLIHSVLNGQGVDLIFNNFKKLFSYDNSKNLLILDHSQSTSPEKAWYTSITNVIAGDISANTMLPSFIQDTVQNTTRLQFLNVDIAGLYNRMLGYKYGVKSSLTSLRNLNRWIWNVKDRTQYEFILENYEKNILEMELVKWHNKNSYCYDAVMPGLKTKEEMAEKMRQDLDAFFSLEAKLETKMTDCWVLVRTSKDDRLLLSGKKDNWEVDSVRQGIRGNGHGWFYFRTDIKKVTKVEKSIRTLIPSILNQTNLPILDETGIKIPVAIAIDVVLEDGIPQDNITYAPERIRDQLKQYGLDIIKTKREMEVFVITEKGNKSIAQSNN